MSFNRNALILILSVAAAFCATAGPLLCAAAGPSEVSLQLSPDGGLEISAPSYHARIGSDGNLHSLRVGETEMLDDNPPFSLGAFFYSEGPRPLGKITLPAPSVVRATDGLYAAEYYFLPGEIRLTLSHASEKKSLFYLVLSEAVTVAANSRTGEVAAVPIEARWSDVTFTASSGAYVTVRGGDRIWGPWDGRQVWELGPLAAGPAREVSISPGLGQPPKPTTAQLLSLRVESADNQQVLGLGRSAQLSVVIENRGEALADGALTVVLKGWQGEPVSELSQEIAIGEKSQARGRFDISLPDPGIYLAQVTLSAGGRPLKETAVMLAYRWEEIRPALSIPPDFDAFWAALLAEARAPSSEPTEFVEDESVSTAQVKVWKVSFAGAGGKRLSGWLCAPTRPGPHPGLLQLPGYGRPKAEPQVVFAGRGYVVLAVEVVEEGSDPAYIARGLESPKEYLYRGIAVNSLRALDLLLSREEVDRQRVAVTGPGQGGGLALIVAALRPEVAAVAADVPMLCDFPRSIREGMWPYTEIARYLQSHPEEEARVWRTLSYFDVLNFAPRLQSPALLSVGLRDTLCRPETVFAAYNYLPGRKEIKIYPAGGHEEGSSAHLIYKRQWLDSILKPAASPPPVMPEADSPRRTGESEQGGPVEPSAPAQ